ncbi:MAG: HepT-like ribonuclease domain-containing protein [Thermodesulfobacteriota bacterium]|nr:HepT-like ribonuclease domain-containing protein [Thermodesulfobacteriota bacterium]
MKLDKRRIEKYLDEIALETLDVKSILGKTDNEILKDKHILKSLKYSTIVIAEAIASALQHILAKRYNTVVDGYMDVFTKSMICSLLPEELLERLKPFIVFRNMLLHQYWKVKDEIFLNNMRNGIKDFRDFTINIRNHLNDVVHDDS